MRFTILVALALLISGCDSDTIKRYWHAKENLDELNKLKEEYENQSGKIKTANDLEQNSRLLLSLISNKKEHQIEK